MEFSTSLNTRAPNSVCDNAIELVSPSAVEDASTANGTTRGIVSCGSDTFDDGSGPGVWYRVIGTGLSMHASTCNSSNQHTVKVLGGPSCGSAACIEGANYVPCDGGNNQVTWTTVRDAAYYIVVASTTVATGGAYSMQIGSSQSNDVCNSVSNIPISLGKFVGSNSNSTRDSIRVCDDADVTAANATATATMITDPGSWVQVEGTGGLMLISGCNSTFPNSQTLTAFENCAGRCATFFRHDECNSSTNTIAFLSSKGAQYSIHIATAEDATDDSFELSLQSLASNAICKFAQLIEPDDDAMINGTIENSIVPRALDADRVQLANFDSPGVWYRFIGTGSVVEIAFADDDSIEVADARFTIFKGNCDALSCTVEGFARCPSRYHATLDTEEGTAYFVVVHGAKRHFQFRLCLRKTTARTFGIRMSS